MLPLILSFNYLTVLVVELGQTSLLFTGCVAAGLWCFERKRPALGVLLWAILYGVINAQNLAERWRRR